jgi:hypothetical protein
MGGYKQIEGKRSYLIFNMSEGDGRLATPVPKALIPAMISVNFSFAYPYTPRKAN